MSAQDKTLDQYHNLMQMNAASHVIRAGRQLGLLSELREGQRTREQLRQALKLDEQPLALILDALVAIGIVEQYQEDYALSRAAHLLCQYDDDLGDSRWQKLAEHASAETNRQTHDDQPQFDYLAATQWIHTPAAIQAAEILNVGPGVGEADGSGAGRGSEALHSSETPLRILDLGCGSAVWSCAMAHRDPQAIVTAVDLPGSLDAARNTADSIGLSDRVEWVEAEPHQADLPQSTFDLGILAQRVSNLGDADARQLIERTINSVKPGGRLAVIDLFRGPTRPNFAEAIEALRLQLETRGGYMRTLEEIQQLLGETGLTDVQFAFIADSKVNLGIAVGTRPEKWLRLPA